MTPPAASAVPIPASRPPRVSGSRGAQVLSRGVLAAPGVSRPHVRTPPRRASVSVRPRPHANESLLARLARVSDHRLLDRLIRGRLWIGVLAFALIGIVAMQLAILSLNRATGQALNRVAQLQRENPALVIANSTAAAGENIEPQAAARGMAMARVGAAQFLASSAGDFARAARILSTSTAPAATQATSQNSEGASAQSSSPSSESEASQAPSQSSVAASENVSEQASATRGQTTEASAQTQTGAQPVSPTSAATTSEASGYPSSQAPTVGSQGGTQAGP